MNGNTLNGDYSPRTSHPTQGQGQGQFKHVDKENQPPHGTADAHVDNLVAATRKLGLSDSTSDRQADFRDNVSLPSSGEPKVLTAEERAYQQERERHLDFIQEALDMVRWIPSLPDIVTVSNPGDVGSTRAQDKRNPCGLCLGPRRQSYC
jgi:hypothetical protein